MSVFRGGGGWGWGYWLIGISETRNVNALSTTSFFGYMGESCWNRSKKSSQKVKEGRRFIDKPVRSSTKQIVEFNTSARSGNIKPTFKNIPLSNIDLQNWCHYLNIKIKGIFSRNKHMPNKHSPCIIILDDYQNTGTHWVSCATSHENNKDLY